MQSFESTHGLCGIGVFCPRVPVPLTDDRGTGFLLIRLVRTLSNFVFSTTSFLFMPTCYHNGGSDGIRTHGRASTRLRDYKSGALNLSATDPPSHSSKDFVNLVVDGGPRISYKNTSSVLAIECLELDGQLSLPSLAVFLLMPTPSQNLPIKTKRLAESRSHQPCQQYAGACAPIFYERRIATLLMHKGMCADRVNLERFCCQSKNANLQGESEFYVGNA